jgi:hypothetical protein
MNSKKKIFLSLLSILIVASNISLGGISASAAAIDQSKTEEYAVNNKKAYVYNPELQIDLKVRKTPDINGYIEGALYNYENVQILDTIETNGTLWDEIIYNNSTAYVSDAYVQHYTSPSDNVVNIARNISKQFEVGNLNQIAGNFDGQGLSLGYFQWCIGQSTLQPLLNRMDREYNAEMKSIFGTNYNSIHNMILDTTENQLAWAKTINDSANTIAEPWYSQFINLCNNQHFINIELDAEAHKIGQAMIICDKYNLKTVRGFALAFDIVIQNGSISSDVTKIIDTALLQKPNIIEKDILKIIANAIADTSTNNAEDIRSRKMSIVNGTGTVHKTVLNLDNNYGLSDSYWR